MTPPALMIRLVKGVSGKFCVSWPQMKPANERNRKPMADGEDDDGELRLPDDAPQHQGIEQIAEHGHGKRRDQQAEPVVHAHGADEGERHERAEHHEVALREVHHLGGFVDQHEAERDQAVDTALRNTADDELE